MMDLPATVKGFTVRMFDEISGDDYYTIVLNSRLSWETQSRTYLHEVDHITYGDFDSDLPVDQIEKIAHERYK